MLMKSNQLLIPQLDLTMRETKSIINHFPPKNNIWERNLQQISGFNFNSGILAPSLKEVTMNHSVFLAFCTRQGLTALDF